MAVERNIAYRDWHRYEHAEFARRNALPFIHTQFMLDVTRLRQVVKARGISFYLSLIWAASKVMESREDFRWRRRGNRIVLIDEPEPSFTDMMAGTELYKIVHAGPAGSGMTEYAQRARKTADAQQTFFPGAAEESRDDFVYFSSTAIVTLTGLTQAMDLDRDNYIPQVAWSRFWEEEGRSYLPFQIKCNHCQVDGLHVARYFTELQAFLDALV